MNDPSPFAGRVKQPRIVGTVEQCREALRNHRRAFHGTEDFAPFFDCGACAVLERALTQAEREASSPPGAVQ
jgi:hypothetical protein